MNIGIMGGTFDPVHVGHLLAAQCALEQAELDEVWFMPASAPPHKKNAPLASAEQRLAMVKLAVEGNPHFRATDIELEKGGTSYTAETVDLLREQYPEHRFAYIIGADMVMYLPKWHRIDDLTAAIGFIGLRRPGYNIRLGELPERIRRSVRLAEMPQVDISSTVIRDRRARGGSIRYLVPERVREYIERNRLYES